MSKILDLIPSWVYAIAIVALMAVAGLQTVRLANSHTENAKQESEFNKAIAKQSQDLAATQKAARDTESNWSLKAAKITQEKNDAIKSNSSRYQSIIDGLRNRTARPSTGTSTMPQTACNCKSGTGAGLYREDSEFLAGEAAESNRRRTELESCYRQYDTIATSPAE